MLRTEDFVNASSYVNNTVSGLTAEERAAFDAASLMCDISIAIVEYRRKNCLSQEELARQLGVGQSMISKYERGDYNWTVRSLVEVSSKLGMKLTLALEQKEMQSMLPEKVLLFNPDDVLTDCA